MSPFDNFLGLEHIFRPVGVGISYFFGAKFSKLKEEKLINDARIEVRVKEAKCEEEENIRKAREMGVSVDQYISDPYGGRGAIQLAQFSKTLLEDTIRQEAKTEAAKIFIEQLREELSVAFQAGNYETVLSITSLLQKQLPLSSEFYNYINNIYIFSLSRLIASEYTQRDKKIEFYAKLPVFTTDTYEEQDFDVIFTYGLANLYMLTVIPVNDGLDYIERAKESFTKTLSFGQDKSLSLLNLALALDCQVRHACTQEESIKILQEAVGYLEQAIAIDPQNYKIFSNLGELYVRLVEVSPTNYEQQHKFFELAIQAFSEGIALYRTFSLFTRKANTLLMLGRIEQDNKAQEEIFQTAKATYNDAYIIAPRRIDAAIACLKIAYILSLERNNFSLSQEKRDNFIFEGLQRYMLALEHAPFYDELQYETAKLILNIAKFGDQDIPLLKKMMQPLVQVVTQKQKGHGRGRFNHAPKQVHQVADHAMLSGKTNLLDASYRYFQDAAYLR